MKSQLIFVIFAAIGLVSCSTSSGPDSSPVTKIDKPFAAGGAVEMQLASGDYTIRAGADDHIRVSFAGNTGNASAELGVTGTRATLTVKDTPHNNFRVTVEVPAAADLAVHLTAGNLEIASIAGNKDIESTAGNVGIAIPQANDYGNVDASVKAGNLDGGPFGNSGSGFAPHLTWSGPGKYTLHATLGAGNLELKH